MVPRMKNGSFTVKMKMFAKQSLISEEETKLKSFLVKKKIVNIFQKLPLDINIQGRKVRC